MVALQVRAWLAQWVAAGYLKYMVKHEHAKRVFKIYLHCLTMWLWAQSVPSATTGVINVCYLMLSDL